MRLIILGSGTPTFTPERWGTSFLLELSNDLIMVDCGPASTYKMQTLGISPTKINHLFFTHYHSDHMADYPCFLMTRFDLSVGEEANLNVYGPPPIKSMTNKIWSKEEGAGAFWLDVVARTEHPMSHRVFEARGGVLPRPEPVLKVHELAANDKGSGDTFHFKSFEVTHAQPYLECYGFRFETKEGTIVFSGDAEPKDELIEHARNADIFVMAAMGFSLPEYRQKAARVAQEAQVKHLVINHQAPNICSKDMQARILAEIRRVYTGELTWGNDLMELSW